MANAVVASAANSSSGSGCSVYASGAGSSYVGDTLIAYSDTALGSHFTSLATPGAGGLYVGYKTVENNANDTVTGNFVVAAQVVSGAIGSFTAVSQTGTQNGAVSIASGAGLALGCTWAVDYVAFSTTVGITTTGGMTTDASNDDTSYYYAQVEVQHQAYSSGLSGTSQAVSNSDYQGAVFLGVVAASGTAGPTSYGFGVRLK